MADYMITPAIKAVAANYKTKFGKEFPLHTLGALDSEVEIVASIQQHIDNNEPATDPTAGKTKVLY